MLLCQTLLQKISFLPLCYVLAERGHLVSDTRKRIKYFGKSITISLKVFRVSLLNCFGSSISASQRTRRGVTESEDSAAAASFMKPNTCVFLHEIQIPSQLPEERFCEITASLSGFLAPKSGKLSWNRQLRPLGRGSLTGRPPTI